MIVTLPAAGCCFKKKQDDSRSSPELHQRLKIYNYSLIIYHCLLYITTESCFRHRNFDLEPTRKPEIRHIISTFYVNFTRKV